MGAAFLLSPSFITQGRKGWGKHGQLSFWWSIFNLIEHRSRGWNCLYCNLFSVPHFCDYFYPNKYYLLHSMNKNVHCFWCNEAKTDELPMCGFKQCRFTSILMLEMKTVRFWQIFTFLTFPAAVFKNTDVQLLFQKSMLDCKGEGKLLQVINRREKVHLPPCKLILPFEFRILNSFSKFNLLRQTAVTVMNSK